MNTLTGWLEADRFYVGGRWRAAEGRDRIVVVNPATGEYLGHAPACTRGDMNLAITAARGAFDEGPWPRMPVRERGAALERLLELYQGYFRTSMAELITAQNGSPCSFTAQVDHPEQIVEWYLQRVGDWDLLTVNTCHDLRITGEPVGVVGIIVPWNMPQKTIFMKMVPALLAGCTVVIKPAPQTPLDALMLATMVEEAGFPPGVVNVVPARNEVAQYLVTHDNVDKIAFTGSLEVGRLVAALCGDGIGRCSLELGGKSPAVVLADADPYEVAASLRADTFTLSGQICSAHTRVLVPQARYRTYVDAITAMAQDLPVGDPTDAKTWIGPLVTDAQRGMVMAHIHQAKHRGARLTTGGGVPDLPGWYVEPTVFADVEPGWGIATEEVFGPVVVVIPYQDLHEAVRIANSGVYGLEAGVWGHDARHVPWVAERLRAGTVRINGSRAPIGAPIGGFKRSGIGRELGHAGLAGYLEVKTVIRNTP